MGKFFKWIGWFLLISRLGDSVFSKVKLFFVALYISASELVPFLPRVEYRVTLSIYGKQHRASVASLHELLLLKEIYIDKVYECSEVTAPRLIIDLGSNVGFSVLYFASLYPEALIHAVEPSPRLYERLVRATSACKNVVLHRLAIAEVDGEVSLFLSHNSLGASVVRKEGTVIRVPAMRSDTFLESIQADKVDILKFDIEGAETALLKGFKRFSAVYHLVGEMHYDRISLRLADVQASYPEYECNEKYISSHRSIMSMHKK